MSNEKSVLKWCLNRFKQPSNTRALLDLCGDGVVNDQYQPCGPSHIILSESLVGSAMNISINKYLNPFDESADSNILFNLSSGEPVPNDLETNILNIHDEGLKLTDDFINKLINSNEVSFHHEISRNKTFTFSETKQKVVIKNKNNVKIVEVNLKLLAPLLCYNMETGKAINFANTLKYPLLPVSLSLGNADGTKKKTDKSTLQKIILKHSSNIAVPEIV